MGCATCANNKTGKPAGCKSNGHCATGGCNKLNTYDWLAGVPAYDSSQFDVVEISFNKGLRKDFFRKRQGIMVDTGDTVVVETQFGYDIGEVTLSGELVKLQMKKKKVRDNDKLSYVLRRANDRDLEKYDEAKAREDDIMVRARVIARLLGLQMKIGAVEVQGDNKKTTFYYTADGRVDFRELIKEYARDFQTKVEMRQIGARQEAGKIGGIGSCGRELCCSTWLTDFKSVSTSAARYQNLSINQAKLSGQCGRLKCCLNYELDQYVEAVKEFPKNAGKLESQAGIAYLQKTDIFKRIMIYKYDDRMAYYKLPVDRVKQILELNKKGEKPEELLEYADLEPETAEPKDDTVGHILLETLDKKEREKKQKSKNQGKGRGKRRKRGGNKSNNGPKGKK